MAKRERVKGESPAAEVDMTPMIDIVFQLIAFFMVITNFEQTQADERVKLPRDALAKPPEVKLEHTLVLNVGFFRNMDGEKTDPQPWLFNFVDGEPVLPQYLLLVAALRTLDSQTHDAGLILDAFILRSLAISLRWWLPSLCQSAAFQLWHLPR